MDSDWKDERFSHVARDPRFRSMPKRERKVKIDKRFQAMFNDDRFKLKYSVDKKGRPTNKTSEEDLKRFYELSDDSDSLGSESGSNDDEENEQRHKINTENNKLAKSSLSPKVKIRQEKKFTDKKKSIVKRMHEKEQSNKSSDILMTGMDVNANSAKKIDKSSHTTDKYKKENKKSMPGDGRECEVDSVGGSCSDELTDDESGVRKSRLTGSDQDKQDPHISDDEEESDVGDGPDLARGEGNISSEDEDDLNWQPDHDDTVEHEWGELDRNVAEATQLGRRLAVCNMDWDRIKATDLFVLLSSFKPTGAVIHSVKIYPSEFGMQRMKEENAQGPMKFVKTVQKSTETTGEQDVEGGGYQTERLRRYQLDRLKYYYAVLECDTVETANHIYKECDGLEYETSSALLDLRFIPDDMEFEQKSVSVCEEMPGTYKPSTFVTAALSQSKVELTWDETERDRRAVTTQKLSQEEIDEMDYKAYLASSSEDELADPYAGVVDNSSNKEGDEEEEEGEEAQIQKYKSLLKDLEETENQKDKRDVEMEITWEPGLREATEQIVKKKGEKLELTVWEQYLERKKEKKRIKREEKMKDKQARHGTTIKPVEEDFEGQVFSDDELPEDLDINDDYFKSERSGAGKPESKKKKKQLTDTEKEDLKQKQAELSLLMMDEDDNHKHFSLTKLLKTEKKDKKKKRTKGQKDTNVTEDTFKFNTDDARFQAMYTSPLYNIDPSAPAFRRTNIMDKIIEEKLKRRKHVEKLVQRDCQNEVKEQSLKRTSSFDSNELLSTSAKMKKRGPVNDTHEKDPSLSSLVKSVKIKTKNYYQRNK